MVVVGTLDHPGGVQGREDGPVGTGAQGPEGLDQGIAHQRHEQLVPLLCGPTTMYCNVLEKYFLYYLCT